MNIKIISDSTCDLSPAQIASLDITLAPLTVVKGDEQFKDGVTITPAEIFEHVANGGALCSTSANSIGEYADIFEQYANDYDGIIHILLVPVFPPASRALPLPQKISPTFMSSIPRICPPVRVWLY